LFDEGVGISQVGIGVATVKVWRWLAVLNRLVTQLQLVDKDLASIRSGDPRKTVKQDGNF
jgi:hypothetical protein